MRKLIAISRAGAAIAPLLSACAGGGGGAPNMPPFPGEAAMNAYLQVAHHTTLHATGATGTAYTLQVDRVPSTTPSSFHGSSAYSILDSFTLSSSGPSSTLTQAKLYFLLNPYVPVGKENGLWTDCAICTVGSYGLVTSSFPLPTTLTAGDSGAFDNLTYDSIPNTRVPMGPVLDGYESTTYTVAADTSETLRLCLNAVVSSVTADGLNAGFADGTATECYTVDAAGTATLVSINRPVNGETLTFR